MKTILKLCFCILLALNSTFIISQTGNPFITNFQPLKIVDNIIFCIEHNDDNIMFFGTSQGILMYNSEEWELIKTPNTVVSLKFNHHNNKLMVGLNGGIGYLVQDETGVFNFHLLNNNKKIKGNFHILNENENEIVFQSQNSLVYVSGNGEEIADIWMPSDGSVITTSFYLHSIMHIVDSEGNIIILNKQKTDTINISNELSNNHIVFTTPFDTNKVLIGLNDGSLFTYDGIGFNRFEYSEYEYANASIINGGLVMQEYNTIVLSSLAGGIILVDMNDGNTNNIINMQSGLPDDEVYSIGVDNTKGIWVSHLYGISRIDINFPVKSYHNFKGLEGNIFSIYKNDTTLFAGTTEGLFYLTREEHFSEKEQIKYIKVKVAVKKKPIIQGQQVSKDEKVTEKTEEKKEKENTGILSKLFSRKPQKNEGDKTEEKKVNKGIISKVFEKSEKYIAHENEKEEVKYIYRRQPVKEKIYLLQSVTYGYKKIPGFNEKIKEIVPLENQLLLLTNIGLFVFDKNEIKPVLPDVYTSVCYLDKDNQKCYVSTSAGLYQIEIKDHVVATELIDVESCSIYGITVDKENNILLGDDGVLHKLNNTTGQISLVASVFEINGPILPFKGYNDEIYLYNKGSIYIIHENELVPLSILKSETNGIYRVFQDIKNNVWITDGEIWEKAGGDTSKIWKNTEKYLTVFDDINYIFIDNENDIWVVDDFNKIFRLNTTNLQNYINHVELIIHNIENFKKGLFLTHDNIELSYYENVVEMHISAPFFIKSNAMRYSYYIEGLYEDWSAWANTSTIRLDYLPTGKYTIQIKARNIFGYESKIRKVNLNILPPFWKTSWFYFLIGIIFILTLFVYIKYRERKLKKERIVLEEKVAERTIEIEMQKNKIEKQALSITDSINYAQRIQEAMLPSLEILKENLDEYFVLFKPRDIVSGDFYWAFNNANELFLTAADCTGHGVPGAFMSMLGISFLNELVKKQELKDPAEILNRTRSMIIELINSRGEYNNTSDGMDIAFCNIDLERKIINYAGAYNPLMIVKNKNDKVLIDLKFDKKKAFEKGDKILFSIDAERMPVGNSPMNKQKFISHKIPVSKGDTFYIFSDGYYDQVGSKTKKKYLIKNFKRKILSVSHLPLNEQKSLLENEFMAWKDKEEQVDDVLVIGFRL